MLPPSKKLKTIKPLEQQQEEEEDTLSSLPQPILHQILSFLPDIKYTILTSTLSKTWSSVSKTTSFLDFNFETYGGITKTRQPYQFGWFTQFLEFVNKVLTSHCSGSGSGSSSSTIQRFSLQCGNKYVIPSSTLKKWIGIVIGRGVQDVSIEFLSEQVVLDLPGDFFSCRSLVNLKLMVLKYDDLPPVLPLFNLPESGPSFLELRTLHLQLVCFDGGFMQKLLSMCSVLRTLVMRNCGVHEVDSLVISGNQLKCLEIDEFYAYAEQRRKNYCRIIISAPNVESFFFTGDLMNDFYIENLASLVVGDIDILRFAGIHVCGKMIETWEKKYDMMKFFGGLSNARSLTLCPWSLEVIGVGSVITPIVFSGLRQLKLKTCLVNNCLPGIKHLLENSCNLEKLTIINSKGHPLCSEGQLMEFSARVLAFQRASSNVEILFSQA